MDCLNEVFPIILYVLGSILLIVLIILVIRIIKTLGKVDKVVDDVNIKVTKLNGLFDIIDNTADAVSMVSDKVVGFISTGINNIFSHRRKRKDEK